MTAHEAGGTPQSDPRKPRHSAGWPDSAIRRALSRISLPVGILDRDGVLRWVNERAIELFGDQRGMAFAEVVAPESKAWVKLNVARLLYGGQKGIEWRATVVGRDGRKFPAEFHAVPVTEGEALIGIFGIAHVEPDAALDGRLPEPLTARQLEVLRALSAGSSTRQIAESLGISTETVRNYVRAVLRALGAHSRLEAVVEARRLGIV
jgi:PAS domain S-box-containing protein